MAANRHANRPMALNCWTRRATEDMLLRTGAAAFPGDGLQRYEQEYLFVLDLTVARITLAVEKFAWRLSNLFTLGQPQPATTTKGSAIMLQKLPYLLPAAQRQLARCLGCDVQQLPAHRARLLEAQTQVPHMRPLYIDDVSPNEQLALLKQLPAHLITPERQARRDAFAAAVTGHATALRAEKARLEALRYPTGLEAVPVPLGYEGRSPNLPWFLRLESRLSESNLNLSVKRFSATQLHGLDCVEVLGNEALLELCGDLGIPGGKDVIETRGLLAGFRKEVLDMFKGGFDRLVTQLGLLERRLEKVEALEAGLKRR